MAEMNQEMYGATGKVGNKVRVTNGAQRMNRFRLLPWNCTEH